MEQHPEGPASGPIRLRPRGDGVAGLGWGSEGVGRHLHGEVGDEGFPGQLDLEGSFLSITSSVDHPAGNNSMGKSGGHPGVHRQAVDVDAILDKGRGRELGCLADAPPTLQE